METVVKRKNRVNKKGRASTVRKYDNVVIPYQIRELLRSKREEDAITRFYQKLLISHPGMTINERKLCGYLKLSLSTNEIASITGKSKHTIEVSRTRLRNKMGLTNRKISLYEYLSEY